MAEIVVRGRLGTEVDVYNQANPADEPEWFADCTDCDWGASARGEFEGTINEAEIHVDEHDQN